MTNELLIVNNNEQLLVSKASTEIVEVSKQGPPGASLDPGGTGYVRFSPGNDPVASPIIQIAEGPDQGIQIEGNWGWRDLIGTIQVHGITFNDPIFVNYGDSSIRQFQFSGSIYNEIIVSYHIPHDYVPNTPIHFHMHWSNAEAVQNAGDVVWAFNVMYAKGHGQQIFTDVGTYYAIQTSPEVQYKHMIAETAEILIPGLEVDGILLVRTYRDIYNQYDTLLDPVFGHMSDIHYRSNSSATKNKAPNFYI